MATRNADWPAQPGASLEERLSVLESEQSRSRRSRLRFRRSMFWPGVALMLALLLGAMLPPDMRAAAGDFGWLGVLISAGVALLLLLLARRASDSAETFAAESPFRGERARNDLASNGSRSTR